MAASSSKSEIQTHLDKKLITFDEKTCRNVDKFPVNFSGVPDIGEKIFGFLDFKDLNNCLTVWQNWISCISTNLPNYIKLAENTFNVEILEYLNSMT